jgi:hypothetical protein
MITLSREEHMGVSLIPEDADDQDWEDARGHTIFCITKGNFDVYNEKKEVFSDRPLEDMRCDRCGSLHTILSPDKMYCRDIGLRCSRHGFIMLHAFSAYSVIDGTLAMPSKHINHIDLALDHGMIDVFNSRITMKSML